MRREPDYAAPPPEQLDPIITEVEVDVRLRLRVDVRHLLRAHGVDAQMGEPGPEQLQTFFIAEIVHVLRGRAYMLDLWVVHDVGDDLIGGA